MIELSPADVIRLRSLGVRADAEIANLPSREEELARRCKYYREALTLAIESERRAWREARQWRLWGYLGLGCAAASITACVLAAVARMGGW